MAVVLLLALLALAGLAGRRRALTRVPGAFDCSARCPGRGWVLGVARYGADSVAWFRVFSLSPRPRTTWGRAELAVRGRRTPAGAEVAALQPASLVVECDHGGTPLDLAMSAEAYTGFASWLEAAPPGPSSSVT